MVYSIDGISGTHEDLNIANEIKGSEGNTCRAIYTTALPSFADNVITISQLDTINFPFSKYYLSSLNDD